MKNDKKISAEVRSDGGVRLVGYVNVTERNSRMLNDEKYGNFVECVAQGAFKKALEKANGDVLLCFNHERKIGKRGENLTLEEDNIGLRADAIVYDEEVAQAARNGELQGWSFGFFENSDEWTTLADGTPRRRLTDIDLVEVSILSVTPAYIATSVEERKQGEDPGRKLERRDGESGVKFLQIPAKDGAETLNRFSSELELLRMKGEINTLWN